MRRIVAVLTAAAFLAATTPALADGSRHGFRGHGGHGFVGKFHGHKFHGPKRFHHHRHRGHSTGVVIGALAGGVVLGHLLSRPAYAAPTYAAPVYVAPPPPPPAATHCLPTTGTGYVGGRLAEFGGTWCRDSYGRAYVVPGSEYVIRYLD